MFLLTSTNEKITDIAIKCGFKENKSFYVRFKQRQQCSPKQYRAWYKTTPSRSTLDGFWNNPIILPSSF